MFLNAANIVTLKAFAEDTFTKINNAILAEVKEGKLRAFTQITTIGVSHDLLYSEDIILDTFQLISNRLFDAYKNKEKKISGYVIKPIIRMSNTCRLGYLSIELSYDVYSDFYQKEVAETYTQLTSFLTVVEKGTHYPLTTWFANKTPEEANFIIDFLTENGFTK